MRPIFIASLIAVAVAAAALHGGAARAQAPELTYQWPAQGETLAEPPVFIQMCFSRALDVRDLDKGGDFDFDLIRPNGLGVGMRIVFQVDGYGLAIYPGQPADDQIAGEWRLEYTVRDRETLEEVAGTLLFNVDPAAGAAVPQETPPACTPESTPAGPLAPGATPTPSPGGSGEDDDDSDTVFLVLLTLGIILAVAVLGIAGYFIRRRAGFSPHDPANGPPSAGAESH